MQGYNMTVGHQWHLYVTNMHGACMNALDALILAYKWYLYLHLLCNYVMRWCCQTLLCKSLSNTSMDVVYMMHPDSRNSPACNLMQRSWRRPISIWWSFMRTNLHSATIKLCTTTPFLGHLIYPNIRVGSGSGWSRSGHVSTRAYLKKNLSFRPGLGLIFFKKNPAQARVRTRLEPD